jgi:hypothetical protein
MRRLLLLLIFLFTTAVLAQDAKDADADTATEPAPEQAAEGTPADDDVDNLDELYPVEEEDEFIPSENVAFGQSIPFPTDI